jgi:hypothetical protein
VGSDLAGSGLTFHILKCLDIVNPTRYALAMTHCYDGGWISFEMSYVRPAPLIFSGLFEI